MTREEFTSRLQTCRKRLFIAALSVTGNREDAEDALSEATLRALGKYESIRDESKFDAWMLTVTMNEAKRLCSKRRYYDDVDALNDCFEDDSGAEGNAAFFDMIFRAGLSARTQKIFIFRFLYGYTLQETASLLHMAYPACRSEYYRGLQKLRSREDLK